MPKETTDEIIDRWATDDCIFWGGVGEQAEVHLYYFNLTDEAQKGLASELRGAGANWTEEEVEEALNERIDELVEWANDPGRRAQFEYEVSREAARIGGEIDAEEGYEHN